MVLQWPLTASSLTSLFVVLERSKQMWWEKWPDSSLHLQCSWWSRSCHYYLFGLFSSREEKDTIHLSGLWRRIERRMRSEIYIARKREGLDLKDRCSTSATNFTHDFGKSHNLETFICEMLQTWLLHWITMWVKIIHVKDSGIAMPLMGLTELM